MDSLINRNGRFYRNCNYVHKNEQTAMSNNYHWYWIEQKYKSS